MGVGNGDIPLADRKPRGFKPRGCGSVAARWVCRADRVRCEAGGREVRRARAPVGEVRRMRRWRDGLPAPDRSPSKVAVAGKWGVWKGGEVGIRRVPLREEGSVVVAVC